MAQKKFSRLSIMLEARDRMSGPMQHAARASQNLQNRVTQLGGALNRSRNSVVNASTANRILAERYRELGRRIAGADEQVKLSTRLFRGLPAPIRLAAYAVEGYAKAIWKASTNNALIRATTAMVTTGFKTMRLALLGVASVSKFIGRLAMDFTILGPAVKLVAWSMRSLWNVTRLVGRALAPVAKLALIPFQLLAAAVMKTAQGFKLLGKWAIWPLKQAAIGAKQLAVALGQAVGRIPLIRAMGTAVKAVSRDIKLAAVSLKTFVKDLPALKSMTTVWQQYAFAATKARQKIGEARIAFELWKNSSLTARKISHVFEDIAYYAKKSVSPIKMLINNFRQLGNTQQQTGRTGRATFNQLADANARLNREVSRLNSQLARSNGLLGKMKMHMGSLNGMGAAFGTAYAAQAAYGTGERGVTATVGKAMEQQYSSESVGILAGKENGPKFYKQIAEYAAQTTYSTEDWARNMRSAISKSSNIEELKKYQTVMEQLAVLDPIQGLDGAALAVRELNSGDSISLQERFELPKGPLKEIRGITDPIKQIEALSEMIGKETGYTVENLAAMKELPLMQWEKMKNSIKTAMGYMGAGALQVIAPLIEKFNKLWDSGFFEDFIATASEKYANFVTKAIGFGKKVWSALTGDGGGESAMAPFMRLFDNVKASLQEGWPNIVAIFTNVRTIFGLIADEVNSKWPIINAVFQKTLEVIKGITSWIINNWTTVITVVYAAVAAFAAFKIVGTIVKGFALAKKAIDLFKNGTLIAKIVSQGFFAVLRANPIGFVISLLIAAGTAFYNLYQRNETFRNAVQACFNWLKEKGAAALDGLRVALDATKVAFELISSAIGDAWEKFKGFMSAIKSGDFSIGLPKWMGGEGFIQTGKKHHGGLNNVPYNGYNAVLHKGERVLTAQENKDYNNGGGRGSVLVSGNTFIVRQDSDIDAIADKLFDKLYGATQTT
jgi:hypothetical protein